MLTNDTISSLRTPLEKNSKITPSNRPMAHCIHLKKKGNMLFFDYVLGQKANTFIS